MEYFEKMNENIVFDEKKKSRVSSSGNKLTDSQKEKKTIVPINKSWNKSSYRFLTNKKPLKIIIKNELKKGKENNLSNFPLKKEIRSKSRHNTSNIKNLQNLLYQNNIKLDLKNLIDKYRPNKIFKIGISNINNNTVANAKTNSDKKLNKFEKIKMTPKSDKHERKFSFSNLKIREPHIKNLFKDYNIKKDEMTNINKYINTNEKKQNDKIYEKNMLFHTQLKNKNNDKFFQLNKNNLKISQKKKDSIEIKNINYFLKHKEKTDNDKNKKSGI